MAHPDRPPSDTRSMVSTRALVLVLCCAGPTLISAAIFDVIGGWLVSPRLLGAAALGPLAIFGWAALVRGHLHRPVYRPPTPPGAGVRPTHPAAGQRTTIEGSGFPPGSSPACAAPPCRRLCWPSMCTIHAWTHRSVLRFSRSLWRPATPTQRFRKPALTANAWPARSLQLAGSGLAEGYFFLPFTVLTRSSRSLDNCVDRALARNRHVTICDSERRWFLCH
jgi:hypothetical protein